MLAAIGIVIRHGTAARRMGTFALVGSVHRHTSSKAVIKKTRRADPRRITPQEDPNPKQHRVMPAWSAA